MRRLRNRTASRWEQHAEILLHPTIIIQCVLNIAIGLALSFSYILFMKFSEMFVYTGALSPGVALWLPNLLFAIIAAVLYKLAPK